MVIVINKLLSPNSIVVLLSRAGQPPATHLLLAHQAVVHRLVGSVAVESDWNVVLEGELLHQHGLLEGSHQSRLHRDVEIRIRDLGGSSVL